MHVHKEWGFVANANLIFFPAGILTIQSKALEWIRPVSSGSRVLETEFRISSTAISMKTEPSTLPTASLQPQFLSVLKLAITSETSW